MHDVCQTSMRAVSIRRESVAKIAEWCQRSSDNDGLLNRMPNGLHDVCQKSMKAILIRRESVAEMARER